MQYYKKTTKKLFFGKYVNKVAIRIPVASYFRGNRLEKTESDIATLRDKFNNQTHQHVQVGGGWSRSYANVRDMQIANEIIAVLKSLTNYSIRVDSLTLAVYSNDSNFINKVAAIKDIHIEETCQAADDKVKEFLLNTPKAIIRKEYTHKYKVTVNALWDSAISFTTWADKLPKIKTTGNSYQFGGYFYVADEKTLSLCHIFLSDKVRKVEELVTSEEI